MAARARPRVLVHVHDLGLGGTQLNALDFAAAVGRRGFDSVIVAPTEAVHAGPTLVDLAAAAGIRVVVYEASSRLLPRAWVLARLARAESADIVHVYSKWGSRPAYWGPSLLARRPLVQTIYEMSVDPENYDHTPLIVGTGYLVDDLADRPGATVLISPPVDVSKDDAAVTDTTEFVASLGIPAGHRRVVMVSRLDANMKALSVSAAIEAMRVLGRDDVVLVVVGSGDAEGRLREEGRRVDAELGRAAVVFTGALANPGPAYAAADVVLGMGGSAARALAFGRALIAQGERGWSELFRPENSRAIYRNSFWSLDEPADPAGVLAGHLRTVLDDDALRAGLGEFGRSFATENFGLEQMADRLAAVYAAAARGYRPRSWFADLRHELDVVVRRLSAPRRRLRVSSAA